MPNAEVEYGVFKTEIKNRFLCIVNVNGIDTLCYIPSSCRLSNFINMNNRSVMLLPIKKKDARTQYSVYAIKYRQKYVPIALSNVNHIVENDLHRRIFSFLGERKHVFREKNIDGYKSDLYIEDTDTIIEIKSIVSFDKAATFPTVFSERANRQLKTIKALLQEGHNVCYMFVSMYGGTRQISINKEQSEYCSLFRECTNLGMVAHGYSLCMNDNKPSVKTTVRFVF